MSKEIVINDEFSITRDKYQWILRQWRYTEPKKEGDKPQRVSRDTYHSSIKQCCAAALDRGLAECSTLKEIVAKFDTAVEAMADNFACEWEQINEID